MRLAKAAFALIDVYLGRVLARAGVDFPSREQTGAAEAASELHDDE